MALNENKTILADEINNLINAAPTNIISDDENEETKARVVERYEEDDDDSDDAIRQSKIRIQNIQFLDELDKRKDPDFMKRTNEAKSKLTLLLNNMLSLQSTLWKQFPETKSINGNKIEDEDEQDDKKDDSMDEEIYSDTEDEGEEKETKESEKKNIESTNETDTKENNNLKRKSKFMEYEKILVKRHKSYVNYRNSVISKWDEKTRLTTTKLNKGTSHNTIERIEFALSDKAKLLKMTQLKRSEYNVIGKSVTASNDDNKPIEEYDPEIYDDDDFYSQLLKDLIEDKMERERRKIKKERKVDTKASKGRRVRYNVHNKLVNYMAPITAYDTWADVAKNELYNSLFGKIKPVETLQH
ncbi:hypothetical protein M0802_011379 [Mischocyttarus mexicanus]|nr:hypothetical protein M0802_011379 [Mischocyttarus mexicanus]